MNNFSDSSILEAFNQFAGQPVEPTASALSPVVQEMRALATTHGCDFHLWLPAQSRLSLAEFNPRRVNAHLVQDEGQWKIAPGFTIG
jgi:hypothetical protein